MANALQLLRALCLLAAVPGSVISSGGPPDVVWTEPSSGVAGSMPLGNGRLGVNVWSESESELALLLSHVDALDENAVLSKIGRLRLALGRPAAAAARVNQSSSWRASYFARNATAAFVLGSVRVRVWVDALQPVVRVESGGGPHDLTVTLELWRNTTAEFFNFTGDEVDGRWCGERFVHPDRVVPDPQQRQLAWYHRNLPAWTGEVEADMRRQGLATGSNPLDGVTFGAIASLEGGGAGPSAAGRGPRTLHAATSDRHQLTVTAGAFVATSSEAFLARLRSAAAKPRDDAAHRGAWAAFWSRSWINVTAAPSAAADSPLAAAAANVTLLSNLNRLVSHRCPPPHPLCPCS
jgi:hypothetical protein